MLQPKNQDNEKMWAIYEAHESYIYQCAYEAVEDESDAENIMQMCFLKIFSEYGKLRELQANETRKYVEAVVQSTIVAYCQKQRGRR